MLEKRDHYGAPVVANTDEFDIPWETLQTIIGGKSIIDLNDLYITDAHNARRFLRAYGFDTEDPDDIETLRHIHTLAVEYLTNTLLPYRYITEIPPQYMSMSIENLLLAASGRDPVGWPNWPCLILKLCHCTAHALWSHDAEAHRTALETIQHRLFPFIHTHKGRSWIGDDTCSIQLVDFHLKANKIHHRAMTKLLYKPGNLALHIFDRIGIRFVVPDLFSAILLIKFLRSRHIITYVNNVPEQARNNLADLDAIRWMYDHAKSAHTSSTRQQRETTIPTPTTAPSTGSFRMIKFVERLLVRLSNGRRMFYPYEVQVYDRDTWTQTQEGESSHEDYERRQIRLVQRRLFGPKPDDP